MKKNLSELVFILDRSGSMSGLERDTVGGFNSVLQKQKGEPGEALVSTVLFNDVSEVICSRKNLRSVEPMREQEYEPQGCTALLDAMGDAMTYIARTHRELRDEYVPEHTIFVIMTDGEENSSRRYTIEQIRRMVKECEQEYGWEFLFLGANIDGIAAAADLGIRADRAVTFLADSEGIGVSLNAVSKAASALRMKSAMPLDASWKADIEKDTRNRRHRR